MEISGRLTRNATVRELAENKSVVNFTVAQDTSYTSKENGRVKRTNYFEVGYWGSAKVAKHLKKGTAVTLEGNVSVDSYTTKDGVFRPILRFTPSFSGINILSWEHSDFADDSDPVPAESPSYENTSLTDHKTINANHSVDDDLPF